MDTETSRKHGAGLMRYFDRMTNAALLFLQRVVGRQANRGASTRPIFDEGTDSAVHRELLDLQLIEKLLGTHYGGFGWRVTPAGAALLAANAQPLIAETAS